MKRERGGEAEREPAPNIYCLCTTVYIPMLIHVATDCIAPCCTVLDRFLKSATAYRNPT